MSVVEAITGSYKTNPYIDSNFIEYPPLIKDVVVQRPSIKKLQAVKMEELTFHDAEGKQSFKVREISWEEWPKKKNLQLVMDPGGMRMQLKLAHDALEQKKLHAKKRYKPLLFVIAPSILGAKKSSGNDEEGV